MLPVSNIGSGVYASACYNAWRLIPQGKRGSLAVRRSLLRDEGSTRRENRAECVRRAWERCGDAFADTPAVRVHGSHCVSGAHRSA